MQRLKRVIKKMAAISVGGAMLSASVTGALALDLADYPSPFVDETGNFNSNTALVVGEAAAASDTLGAVGIARQLQFDSKVCVPSAGLGGGVTLSGDAVEIGDSSDLLEIRESIGDVRETVTEIELDGLRGGVVTTNEGTTEFNQYLRFQSFNGSGSNTVIAPQVNFTANDAPTDEVGDWLYIKEGTGPLSSFFEYELEFEDGLETEVVGTSLDDLEDEEIVILGSTYTFVDTKIDTAKNDITLELLGGAIYDVLEEGEVRSYTIDGKEYSVEVLIIEDVSPATVTLVINGEVTDQLVDGETEILKDGLLIGVSDIILNEAGEAGSGDLVELYLGATKLELRDSNYTDSETNFVSGTNDLGFDGNVEIDEETIEDAFIQIRVNEIQSDKIEIFTMKYRLTADALPGYKDIYVPPGSGVREFLDEPQGMLGTNWDLRYEGLDDTGISVVRLDPSGDDEYNLEFENRQGLIYKFPYVSNEGNKFKFGDDDDDLVFLEGNIIETGGILKNQTFNIGILDYFVLSDVNKNANAGPGDGGNGTYMFNVLHGVSAGSGVGAIIENHTVRLGGYDDTSFSHVVRYNSIDTSDKQLQFDDLATGSKEFVYEDITGISGVTGKAELIFGGNTYKTWIANLTESGGDNPLAIDMDNDGDVDRTEIRLTINGGGILDLGASHFSDGGFNNNSQGPAGHGWTWQNSPLTGQTLGSTTIDPVVHINAGQLRLNLTTLSENFDENKPTTKTGTNSQNEHVSFLIETRSNGRIGIANTTDVFLQEPDEDDDNEYGMTDYGVFVNIFDPEGVDDAETLTLEYPLVQRGARVFVTMGDTTAVTTTSEACSVADINLPTFTDAELSNPTAHDLIVVGGPCANTVAASVVGCDDFRSMYNPGEAVLQLADNGEKVALLVAGYNAIDTRVAASALSNYDDYTLSGDSVVVTGTISAPQISVA